MLVLIDGLVEAKKKKRRKIKTRLDKIFARRFDDLARCSNCGRLLVFWKGKRQGKFYSPDDDPKSEKPSDN
jgi:uncharacterized protein with PIN domain